MSSTLIFFTIISFVVVATCFVVGWTRNKRKHCQIEDDRPLIFLNLKGILLDIAFSIFYLVEVQWAFGESIDNFLENNFKRIATMLEFGVWALTLCAICGLFFLIYQAGKKIGKIVNARISVGIQESCENNIHIASHCPLACENCPLSPDTLKIERVNIGNSDQAFHRITNIQKHRQINVVKMFKGHGKKVFAPLPEFPNYPRERTAHVTAPEDISSKS